MESNDWGIIELEILRTYLRRVAALRDTATREGRMISPEELNAALTPTAAEEAQCLADMDEAIANTLSKISTT